MIDIHPKSIVGPRPTTVGTSPEPCTGGRSGSGRAVSVQRQGHAVKIDAFLTLASFSISAYVFPSYSKIGSQPARSHASTASLQIKVFLRTEVCRTSRPHNNALYIASGWVVVDDDPKHH